MIDKGGKKIMKRNFLNIVIQKCTIGIDFPRNFYLHKLYKCIM